MKSVLIIDDEARNTFALSAVLKARGYKTFIANNMVEAFGMLEREKEIGIILLDMMMPGMDGYDAIPVLKSSEAFKHLPVIAVLHMQCLAIARNALKQELMIILPNRWIWICFLKF